MGGRGSSSPGSASSFAALPDDLPYNVTGHDDPLGGAIYPFLEEAGRAWRLLTRPVGQEVEYELAHTFGKAGEPRPPTLRWVNGEQVSDLYVDGMDTEQFLAVTGLRLDLHKGAFVLSKRISRLMRPHFVSGFFAPEEVRVAYMEQDAREAKVWDGAGLISREMLEKMTLSEDLPPPKRERLLSELKRAGRVEFTVMGHATSGNGQDKGHAIVVEDLRDDAGNPVDFLLPRDTKREVRLVNGQTFVGLSFVHGKNDMRLDIQSLINLHPFFQEEQLLAWLRQEGELFARSVEAGTAGQTMARVDGDGLMAHTTLDEVASWPLREYLVSGGHPLWFRSHTRSLMNQHLERLNHSTLEKMRLPIPGGRHYVMPAAAGRRAGMEGLEVAQGEIKIDTRYGTAWVNDEDWLALEDSPDGSGIADILGGADHDDALWLFPFTDHDGEKRVLAWRSPNQVGEYVVLSPTADSHIPSWETATGEAAFPTGDSRRLPARVDTVETVYLGLVDPATAGGLGEGSEYTVDVMDAAIERALANEGALGMYCNSLMVNKTVFGRLPENPPAPLEDIIDSAVKTGADLSGVVAWNYDNSQEILEAREPVPALLHHRLSVNYADKENRPPPPRASQDHWLDRLEAGVREHVQGMIQKRDELVARAMPPAVLFDSVAGDAEAVVLGAGLNQVYGRAMKEGPAGQKLEAARLAAEAYLAQQPAERRPAILRGALVSAYVRGGETPASDAVAWLAGEKDAAGQRRAGLGHETARALRDIGLLDEVAETEAGLLVYPNAAPEIPAARTIGLNGVWFHLYRQEQAARGRPVPETMNEVPRQARRQAKARVAEMVEEGGVEMELTVREEAMPGREERRLVAYTVGGQRIGLVSLDSAGRVTVGKRVKLRILLTEDGNVRGTVL